MGTSNLSNEDFSRLTPQDDDVLAAISTRREVGPVSTARLKERNGVTFEHRKSLHNSN